MEDTAIVLMKATEKDMGKICYFNCALSNLLHFKRQDLLDNNINMLIPEFMRSFHEEKVRQFVSGEEPYKKLATKTVYMLTSSNNIIYTSLKVEIFPDIG